MNRLFTLVAAFLALALVFDARAQAGWHRTALPDVDREALTTFIEEHVPTEEVADLIRVFYDDYVDAFEERRNEFAERIERGDASSSMTIEWAEDRRRFFNEFQETVRPVFDGEQIERWDAFVQAQRRIRILGEMNPYQSNSAVVDLGRAIDEIDLTEDERDAVEPLLEEYYRALDQVLEAFEEAMPGILGRYYSLPAGETRDDAAADFRSHLDRVRKLNDEFARRFAEALGPTNAAAMERFRDAWGIPTLYNKSIVDHVVSTVKQGSRLPAAVQRDLSVEYDNYVARRAVIRASLKRNRDRWMEPQRFAEREKHFRELMEAFNRGEKVNPKEARYGSPIIDDINDLIDLESATLRRMHSMIEAAGAMDMLTFQQRFLITMFDEQPSFGD